MRVINTITEETAIAEFNKQELDEIHAALWTQIQENRKQGMSDYSESTERLFRITRYLSSLKLQ